MHRMTDMTVRQIPTNVLVIYSDGRERAFAALGVRTDLDKRLSIQTAEHVYEDIEGPAEVLLISDRGTCWHRFKVDFKRAA